MAFSLQDFQDKAAEKYKGMDITDGPGGPILFTFRSSIRLNDAENQRLSDAHAALKSFYADREKAPEDEEAQDATKPSEMKELIVNVLVTLADKTQAARTFLKPLDMAVVMTIFQQYQEETQAAEGN